VNTRGGKRTLFCVNQNGISPEKKRRKIKRRGKGPEPVIVVGGRFITNNPHGHDLPGGKEHLIKGMKISIKKAFGAS